MILNKGYGLMPNTILFDNKLTDKQKLFFVLISSLCAERGECWATNQYFAEKFNCTETTVSTTISKLKELGYIFIDNGEGKNRIIKMNEIIIEKKEIQEVGTKLDPEELKEIILKWNGLYDRDKNWHKTNKITGDLILAFRNKRKLHKTFDDFKIELNIVVGNYLKEIKSREDTSSYYKHRFTFLEFLKQSNGYNKFLNF